MRLIRPAAGACAIAAFAGCADLGRFIQIDAPTGPRVTVQIPRHVLRPTTGTVPSQTIGGVKVSAWVIVPEPVRRFRLGEQKDFPPAKLKPGQRFTYQVQTIPYYQTPDRPIFHVHFENALSRPLRLKGALLALRVGGRQLDSTSPPEGYEEIGGLIILPGSSKTLRLPGPTWDKFDQGSTIELVAYDVPTNLDAASNPTERSQFTWRFDYSRQNDIRSEPLGTAMMQQGPGDYNGPCKTDYCSRN